MARVAIVVAAVAFAAYVIKVLLDARGKKQ